MSSTAIAVQTMGERNLIATPAGKAAFAVLLFQDIAAIPLIALVPLLGAGGVASQSGWLGAVNAIAAIVAVVVIGRFLTRPLLRAIAGTGIREVFTAFALLLVIGIAQLMTEAGLSMALGAFLAGVLLASSEYRHALETDIAPFKGLLLGLFFIAIGMSIDFGLMLAQPALLAVLVVGLLAAKGAALWGIARALGVAGRERLLFAALLAQGGEFAFVVFAVAREARVLPGNWEALLTASVALSMAATPLLLLGFDQLCDRDAQRGAEADEIDDDSAPVIIAGFGRYGQIVARVLAMHDIASTVLDHDPDQIELLRRFGSKVFYGDATRLDLLEAAGAAKARLLVVAIDEMDESLKLVDLVRQHFPNLAIVARARNVRHYLELRERGIDSVERETFDAALRTGRSALERLGVGAFEAREIAESFRRYNQKYLDSSLPYFRDEKRSVAMVKDARQQLEEQLRNDREARSREREGGWG